MGRAEIIRAMDRFNADAVLDRIRELVKLDETLGLSDHLVAELVAHIADLDEWLTIGGNAPSQWQVM